MKTLFKFLPGLALILSVSLNAQTTNSVIKSQQEETEITPSDSKTKYINNQDYLSKSSLKDYKNYYKDSLKGFDEAAVRADLLARHFLGQEIIAVMDYNKRDFINKKYQLGNYAPKPANTTPPSPTNSKPIGGPNMVNVAPCVNEDFESSNPGTYTGASNSLAITGWTVESTTTLSKQLACNTPSSFAWTPGSPEFSIVATPVFNHPIIGTIPNSPLGGSNVARLNDAVSGFTCTRISQTFPVTSANTLFQFAYCGSWDGSGHLCCDQPFFTINLYDCNGNMLSCSSVSLTPPGPSCPNGLNGYTLNANNVSYTNWQTRYIDLTPYVGSCVTLRVINGDCDGGAHHGSLYFDAKCGGQLVGIGIPGNGNQIAGPVSFCAGSSQAMISAPLGYATYSWVAPFGAAPLAPSMATLSTITVTNPLSNSCYTVYLNTPSGCQFSAVNCIVFSTVSIVGIGSNPSCSGGASGSATVQGNGSGTGYTYTWTNSNGSVVGTTSLVTGLPTGLYSVTIAGQGASSCGTAMATTSVFATPPGTIAVSKPFCGNVAYLNTTGGTNIKWYTGNPLALISPSLGGANATYTVNNPQNLSVYWLSYLSNQGCQDSVQWTLFAQTPGAVSAQNISWICPGGTNGTAVISLTPAVGYLPGFSTYSVWGTPTASPQYIQTLGPTNQNQFPIANLSAGTYSMRVFDGSCTYSTTFNMVPFVYNYTLGFNPAPAVVVPTLCPGNNIAAGITFTAPPQAGQYTYTWFPNQFLAGNNATALSTIISPTTPVGTSVTIVYTVTVVPGAVYCPISKTMSLTLISPPVPTITAIPNLCNNMAPYQIVTNPPGGVFATGIGGTGNPVNPATGVITPSAAGVSFTAANQFTYTIVQGPCSNKNTGSYFVSQFNTAALTTPTIPNLCITNSPYNLMNIVQNTNGSWSGVGTVNNGTKFDPGPLSTGNYMVVYSTTSTPNPTVCPSSSTLNVAVTATLTPTITAVQEFCTNLPQFNMTVTPSGGNWLPTSALAASGLVTPTLMPIGSPVNVTYTVNIGPCLNVGTTTLLASKFYPAGFTSPIPPLCYNSNLFNLMSVVQSTVNGSWSGPMFGQVNPIVGAVGSQSLSPSTFATGVYTFSYNTSSYPNANLCPDVRTITVSVLNPPMPSIIQVGPLCSSYAPMQLTVTPNTGYWTGTPYLNTNGVFTPSLASVGNNAVQYMIGTSTCNVQQTKFISVEAFVPATIIGTIPDQCTTNPAVNLTPLTISSGVWTGAGISGTNFNPATSGAGNYVLLHSTASSPSGLCPDQATVAVSVYSLAVPTITQLDPICDNALPKQLQVSPVGGLFSGANMGVITSSGLFSPASGVIGDNIVNYSITVGPCMAYAQTIIKVEKFVSANFTKQLPKFCNTDQPVNMNSFVENPNGNWQGDGMVGNMFTPSQAHIGIDNKIIYQTHSITYTLCPDMSTITIEVRQAKEIHAVAVPQGSCAPVEVIFNTSSVTDDPGSEAIWNVGDGSAPLKGTTVTHIYTTPGTYKVQLDYTDGVCKSNPDYIPEIVVHEIPKADFSVPDEVLISNPRVQLINLTTPVGNNSYDWTVSNVGESHDVNPNFEFKKIGKYQIRMVATSLANCVSEISKTIEVKNVFNIFMPNSFTPNYDGLNDFFKPEFTDYGLDVKSFEMEVFDRWGERVYHTRDIYKGWDGTLMNKGDVILKKDVYTYKLKYKDLDGNVFTKTGFVTLQ